jgi:RHS repeat-associated protein
MTATLRWQGAAGRTHDITYWNNTVTTFGQYDMRGRVGEIRTESGTGGLLAGRAFGYTPASTRSHERKLGQAGADYVFEHDVFGRLTNVRKGTWDPGTESLIGTVNTARRTFDGANSMLLLEEGVEGTTLAQTPTQTDVTNAYTAFGGLAVSRDKRGNTTQIGNEFLVYDVLGHLVGLTDNINAPSNIWYEVWDAEDRRVYRTDFTGDRAFIWDGQTLLQEKNLGTGQIDREYLLGPGTDNVLGHRIAGVPFAFHADYLSTPYSATDATGAVAERYDIEPFGRTTVTQGPGYSQPLGSKVGLHGGWFDHDTSRIYYRQRVYDPVMARFLSRDPVGVWGDALNLGGAYCFVGNNPTLWRDPTGLTIWVMIAERKVEKDKRGATISTVEHHGKYQYDMTNGQLVKYVPIIDPPRVRSGFNISFGGDPYMGGLVDKEVYKGDNAFAKEALEGLNAMRKDTVLANRLKDLAYSMHDHTIDMMASVATVSNCSPEDYDKRRDGVPTGSTVRWNNVMTNYGSEATPNDRFKPWTGLAHELLGHAWDNDKGLRNTEVSYSGVSMHEVNAVNIENRARIISGDKERTHYGRNEVPKTGFKPPRGKEAPAGR